MKKLIAFVMVACLLLGLTGCDFNQVSKDLEKSLEDAGVLETTPTQESVAGGASFTVTVVHGDGSTKEFTYQTEAPMLGDFLEEQGLIDSQGADQGMFHTVDGEKADWNVNQSYWALYLGEEYAMAGIYDTPITEGAVYKLVYTIG